MKLNDLFEKRREPESNPKESAYDFILKHAGNPNAYLHTTSLQKVGINPKSNISDDTPLGIYCFKLSHIKEDIKKAKERELSLPLALNYYGGDHFFILETNRSYPEDTLESYSKEDAKKDIETLKQMFDYDDEHIDYLFSIAKTNENFVNAPIGIIWGMVKAIAAGTPSELSHQVYPDNKKWNAILRQLGFEVINDSGYGFIHGAERTQSLILSKQYASVLDHMNVDRKQSKASLGGKTYKGGRAPKHLKLKSFDPSEISDTGVSIKDETYPFKKVKTLELESLQRLERLKNIPMYFPSLESIVIHNAYYTESFQDRFREQFDIPDVNLSIDNLFLNTTPLIDKDYQIVETLGQYANNIKIANTTQKSLYFSAERLKDRLSQSIGNKIDI